MFGHSNQPKLQLRIGHAHVGAPGKNFRAVLFQSLQGLQAACCLHAVKSPWAQEKDRFPLTQPSDICCATIIF